MPQRFHDRLRDFPDYHDLSTDVSSAQTPYRTFARTSLAYNDGVLHTANTPRTKGIIVVHDCNPASALIATPLHQVEKAMQHPDWSWQWSGDVWKAVAALRTRADLRIFVLDVDFGLAIITRGKPETIVKFPVDKLSYQDLEKDREHILNLKQVAYLDRFLGQLNF